MNIAKSLGYIGDYHYYDFRYDSAYFYYSKAEKIQRGNNKKFVLDNRIKYNKASILLFEKNFAEAEVEFVKVLKTAKLDKDEKMIYDCYLALGIAQRSMNNNQGAIEYYYKALKQTDNLKNDSQYNLLKAQPYNYIALALQNERRYFEAIKISEIGLNVFNSKEINPTFYCYLINTYSYSKFKLGDDSSLEYFKKTSIVGDSLGNIHIQLNSKLYLSEYYQSKKDSALAKQYANEARTLAHSNKIFEDELKALELLAKIDPQNDSAYNKRYIILNDSLQNVERATRNKFARIEFETDEITNQKNLVEAENDKLLAQRWMIVGFSLFFISLLILLYVSHLQRSKNRELQHLQQQQKANEEIYKLMLDQQQKIEEGKQIEQRRISKELHDGIMGKLTAIRLNLFVLSKRSDPETIARCVERVDEIQDIEKEIRKISHDLNHNLFTDVSDFKLMVANLMEAAKGHSQLQFKLIIDEKIDWNAVNSVVKMQVYRILQEALQNIQKYADAKSVCIRMAREEGHLTISVTDDGIGFDPKTIKPGIGHKNMQERATEINSELTIWSEIGKGTRINLTIVT
ncbi:MAG TPA: ATP-binding protein [Flavobacterium sp.]|uniref:tetratricopeptide repeat-containing sensor histidine kinase n=1 Tax=Flavobacterium sp. TaxID=239 RepID=UPI002CD9C1A1|nr:ATP-binding protein [Flavobacterium sp.]HSD15476.1 ATP-binding protein [Flavobacterium sp.]